MKKILVTGGEGFIGRPLCNALADLGHSVISLDIAPKVTSNMVTTINGNIDDHNTMKDLISRVDTVIHLAAIVGVKFYIDQPYQIFQTNFEYTQKIAKLCIANDASLIFASTSEIYGKNIEMPLTEGSDSVIGGTWDNRWVYAESKAFAERYLLLESKTNGLLVKIFRPFNVVGPGQNQTYGSVMPKFIRSAINNCPVSVYGDGQQTRSFCYIDDMVSGILSVILNGQNGEVYNIGNTEEISISELASLIIQKSKSESKIEFVEYDKIYPGYSEINRRVPDISKALSLGWEPKVNLDTAIEKIIDSYRKIGSV